MSWPGARLLLGAIPVSIYGTSSAEQIAYIAKDAGFDVLVTQISHLERVREALGDDSACRIVVLDGGQGEGTISWEALLSADPIEELCHVDPESLLTIIYTSGTTGPPKGVELTHRSLLEATRAIGTVNERLPMAA
jgi:long-subunit acyl-CoA synthetase (AMP-forming)